MSIFSDYLLTIDYPNQQISFYSGNLEKEMPNTVEYIEHQGLFQVSIKVGSHTIPLHLDSGSSAGFTLTKEWADLLTFATEPIAAGRARTVGRDLQRWRGTLDGVVKLADLEFINPEIDIIEGMEIGQIGQRVLKNLIIKLDQRHQLLSFKRP